MTAKRWPMEARMNRKEEAKQIDAEVRKTMLTIERTWVMVGKLCSKVRARKLWQELGFKKFDAWFEDAVGRRKSTIYLAMSAVEELAGDVPDHELEKMTLANAGVLAKVPKKKRKGLLKAAQSDTEREFVERVNGVAPEAHVEAGNAHLEWWVAASLADVVRRVIGLAKTVEETESESQAIEAIFSEYERTHEGYEGGQSPGRIT